MPQIERAITIAAPLPQVFAFLTDIRNHPRLTPPETQEQLLDAGGMPLCLGTEVTFCARYGGRFWTLRSRITAFEPPHEAHPDRAYFRDEQVRGPFARWRHDHWFEATSSGETRLTDRFTYSAPFGPLGWLAERLWLNRRLRHLLEHLQSSAKRLLESDMALAPVKGRGKR
jgi:ligand-binding SRPBCC domain-containing protein